MIDCAKCGLRNPETASTCGRCSTLLRVALTPDELNHRHQKAMIIQVVVMGIGMFAGLVAAIVGMISIDDDMTMILWFVGSLVVSAIGSYLVSALLIRRLASTGSSRRRMSDAEIIATVILTGLISMQAASSAYAIIFILVIWGLVGLAIWHNRRNAVA